MQQFLRLSALGNRPILRGALMFSAIYLSSLLLVVVFTFLARALGIDTGAFGISPGTMLIVSCVSLPFAVLAVMNDRKLAAYRERLEAVAGTDSLTGLLNRRFFRAAVAEEMQRMQRTGSTAGLVIFDLDHFKSLNDTYGHKAGDTVLQAVAHTAGAHLRGPFDKLGRWGGEEFVIMLSGVTLDQAAGVADRIRECIAAIELEVDARPIRVSASFGVSLLCGDDRFDDRLELADQALYAAKEGGRNTVRLAPSEMDVAQQVSLVV